jgi:hypothetical protein
VDIQDGHVNPAIFCGGDEIVASVPRNNDVNVFSAAECIDNRCA